MKYLTESQKQKLNQLNFSLKKNRDRISYTSCLAYTSEMLKELYTDGYVTSLEIFPELKRCVFSLADFQNESVPDFINGINGLKAQPSEIKITTSSQFEYAYNEAKRKLFTVSDCLKFYFACDLIAKYCGVTPSETQADFFLSRLKPGQTFNFNGYPAPNRESLLVHAVKCARENLDFQSTLPTSYLLYLSSIVAKNEHMTVSEWYEQKIKPLSNCIPTPMPYMLASEKSIRDELAMPESEKLYFRKIVHYISWNKLPKDIIVNILPSFAQTNSYLQKYKNYNSTNHKLCKPNCYCDSFIYKKISDISWSNPNNFIGPKNKEFYNAVLNDLRFFIGDSNILENPPSGLRPILLRLKKILKNESSISNFLKHYDNPEIINQRKKFKEDNSRKASIPIKSLSFVVENKFIKELMLNYSQNPLPNKPFEQPLGQMPIQISKQKQTSKKVKKSTYGRLTNDDIKEMLKKDFPDGIITVPLITIPYHNQILYAAYRARMLKSEFIESLGFKATAKKSRKKLNNMSEEIVDVGSELAKQLEYIFPDRIITKKIKGSKLYSRIRTYARQNNTSVLQCYKNWGFECEVIDTKILSEKEFWQIMSKMYANKIIPKDFECSQLGRKGLSFAKSHNQEFEVYANSNGYLCAKLYNENATNEEILKKL